ncbi:MAG TPA: hypothetical protein PK299_11835 [Anaerolineales bacterium]|nr:hypothetical protein [Anaerolineales bacterium]
MKFLPKLSPATIAGWVFFACLLAGCANTAPLPTASPTLPAVVSPTTVPLPTLALPIPASLTECGAEAAITLAQYHADWASAVEQVVGECGNESCRAQVGESASLQARSALQAYAVPACLQPAQQAAVAFFSERELAYQALQQGDSNTFTAHLAQGESQRQTMVSAIEQVLAGGN